MDFPNEIRNFRSKFFFLYVISIDTHENFYFNPLLNNAYNPNVRSYSVKRNFLKGFYFLKFFFPPVSSVVELSTDKLKFSSSNDRINFHTHKCNTVTSEEFSS